MIKIVLLFGGRSTEHDVSILSARSLAEATDRTKVELTPICIGRDGRFITPERSAELLHQGGNSGAGDDRFPFETWVREYGPDLMFPLIHGTGGEDGSLQGYLEILGLPYAGSGVTASAIGMDKAHMKHAFAAAKLPIVDYVSISEYEWRNERERIARAVTNALRLPYFVKPANGGSSVGITKVKNDETLAAAVETAFHFDSKVLVERGLDAREIEVAILGNDLPQASVPGEIMAGAEFYDYNDKYVQSDSSLIIPARLNPDKAAEIQRLAVTAFRTIGAAGFARVDFFLERGTNRLFVNEINTIPGFTKVSMYPKLWEATELKYARLIEKVIKLGLERSASRRERTTGAMAWLEQAARLS